MHSRVSYAAVGVFVLALGAALIGIGLWLAADISTTPLDRYSVYFKESVSGLNRNAPVKYRGVVVGRVERIELAANDPGRVHLVIAVEAGTPIKTDTKAKLDPQGVTGILHLELTDGTREAPRLRALADNGYPVIESTPSLFTRLDQAVTEGLTTLDDLGGRLAVVLNEDNQERISRTLANLERFSGTLADNGDRLETTLKQAEQLLTHGAEAAARLPALVSGAQESLGRFDAMTAEIAVAGERIGELADSGRRQVQSLGDTTLPEVDRLLGDLRRLADSLARLSEELRDNPRMLIFGRPDGAPGPGE